MKRLFSIFFTLGLVLALFAQPAEAMPKKFRKCPQVKQDGITYILWDHCAIVYKTPKRATITIPNKIKVKKQTYLVSAIWDHTFKLNGKLKTVNLKAKYLECIEDPAIFDNPRIKVNCYDRATYRWLKSSGVNVGRKF